MPIVIPTSSRSRGRMKGCDGIPYLQRIESGLIMMIRFVVLPFNQAILPYLARHTDTLCALKNWDIAVHQPWLYMQRQPALWRTSFGTCRTINWIYKQSPVVNGFHAIFDTQGFDSRVFSAEIRFEKPIPPIPRDDVDHLWIEWVTGTGSFDGAHEDAAALVHEVAARLSKVLIISYC